MLKNIHNCVLKRNFNCSPCPDLERSKHVLNISKYINNKLYNNLGLSSLGIKEKVIYHNLNYGDLLKHELDNNEGTLTNTHHSKTFSINTGKFTGRSPNDKWIVQKDNNSIWWGTVNKPINDDIFKDIYNVAINHFNSLDKYYVYDGYCGYNDSRKHVRFIHELSWQQHFVKNMFIEPNNVGDIYNKEPHFTIINACSKTNEKWKEHNLNSEVAIVFDIEKRLGVILGTWYGGENKKGVFSLMNYWLPKNKVLSMHCSANIGEGGDTSLFFGLSGTGKTTLSADSNRYLIGDDEHGWDDNGIFNLEGGCYAKTNELSEKDEPIIYQSIKQNALLENVSINSSNKPNYFDTTITENGRVSYPINHANNWHKPQIGGHPQNIIFLTCDAFGVLPPISKLSKEQAIYYFLSGYTSKVAGTERGITEPSATFSSCFGEAFLTLHPNDYANILKDKIDKHQPNIYLVNTGWTGGGYGTGNRIKIKDTRHCINNIFNGNMLSCEYRTDPVFNLQVPVNLPNVPTILLDPKNTWDDPIKYDLESNKLATMFKDNYKKYITDENDYSKYGPK